MPAEAIHLSALEDTRSAVDGAIARAIAAHSREARLGAVLVDLPYFENFPVELARYVLRRTPRPSLWGDRLHRVAPSRVGLELLRAARRGGTRRGPLTALALGYLSHAAVDHALHPLVNRLARVRAKANSSTEAAEHREVEKFQSILFHERRLGSDRMGTRDLLAYIDIDGARVFSDGALRTAVDGALHAALGESPGSRRWQGWSRGYWQYTRVLGSPLGKLPAPPAAKDREREELYLAPHFDAAYLRAVERSRRWVTAGFVALDGDRLTDENWFTKVPEGSIDDPPPEEPAWPT
jgi:hypothetical protein